MSKTSGGAMANRTLIDQAAECLDNGGVVFLPTDTVFGLAVRPDRPEAVARLFALKARPAQRNLPVMVSSKAQLEAIGAEVNERVERLMNSPFCPGPLSIALGLDRDASPDWLAGRDEIAFRMPDDRFLLDLLDTAGPLLVTSANRHGMGTLGSVEAALAQLEGKPDMVIDGRECGSVPSTLVNCRFAPPKIERVGAVSPEALEEYFN